MESKIAPEVKLELLKLATTLVVAQSNIDVPAQIEANYKKLEELFISPFQEAR